MLKTAVVELRWNGFSSGPACWTREGLIVAGRRQRRAGGKAWRGRSVSGCLDAG